MKKVCFLLVLSFIGYGAMAQNRTSLPCLFPGWARMPDTPPQNGTIKITCDPCVNCCVRAYASRGMSGGEKAVEVFGTNDVRMGGYTYDTISGTTMPDRTVVVTMTNAHKID